MLQNLKDSKIFVLSENKNNNMYVLLKHSYPVVYHLVSPTMHESTQGVICLLINFWKNVELVSILAMFSFNKVYGSFLLNIISKSNVTIKFLDVRTSVLTLLRFKLQKKY